MATGTPSAADDASTKSGPLALGWGEREMFVDDASELARASHMWRNALPIAKRIFA
jgi:hypothetical protein